MNEVRVAALRVERVAVEVRTLAEWVVAAAGATDWQSVAAAGCRRRLGEEAMAIRGVAGTLEHAVAALRRHAEAVEQPWRVVVPGRLPGGDLLGWPRLPW
jgi:hypothetical protein